MTEEIADWENDPAYRNLKRQYDTGEISRADFERFGQQFKRARKALGLERWKLLNGPIEPGTEDKIAEALAILSRAPDVPPDPGDEVPD